VAVPEPRRRIGERCTRRRVLKSAAAFALLGGARRAAESQEVPPELRRLIAANRILANEGVVDAFGHVSVRDPRESDRFWLSRSRSPALVELDDLM
jgi:HCOMODA/2-hydroxy-3-carboxy-muconic semialdehyde decarboxylase